ncbi:MAG: hypothetical protein DYH03_05485 [Nitrospira sp. NTP1]|nr:hypothetical protein [Nitrospira sp. NTP1]
MDDSEKSRHDFLLKLYETAWKNIIRTDELLWKVFLTYASVVLSTLFLSDKVFNNLFYGIAIALAITAIATCHAFNVNLWFMRNLVLISNVEIEFLNANDYGVLIPAKWKPPFGMKFFNFKEFPSLLGYIYPIFAAFICFPYWTGLSPMLQGIVAAWAAILFILSGVYIHYLNMDFASLKDEAPGQNKTGG